MHSFNPIVVLFLSGLAVASPAPQEASPITFTDEDSTTTYSVEATMTDVLGPAFEGVSPLASIVAVDATATTFVLRCPPGTDQNDCGFGTGITVTSAPTAFGIEFAGFAFGCDVTTDPAVLSGEMLAACTGSDLTAVTTVPLGEVVQTYATIEVTAGAEKLAAATAAPAATTTAASGDVDDGASEDADAGAFRSGVGSVVVVGVAGLVGAMLL